MDHIANILYHINGKAVIVPVNITKICKHFCKEHHMNLKEFCMVQLLLTEIEEVYWMVDNGGADPDVYETKLYRMFQRAADLKTAMEEGNNTHLPTGG